MKQRACLYLRVSSDEQSTDLQRDDLVRYADLRGWEVVEIFEDHWTGTNDQRPAFQRIGSADFQGAHFHRSTGPLVQSFSPMFEGAPAIKIN